MWCRYESVDFVYSAIAQNALFMGRLGVQVLQEERVDAFVTAMGQLRVAGHVRTEGPALENGAPRNPVLFVNRELIIQSTPASYEQRATGNGKRATGNGMTIASASDKPPTSARLSR